MVKRHMIDAHRLERWGCLNDLVEQCVWFHCAQVPLTLRLSCGARAPQRLCPRPPARRLLQPVVSRSSCRSAVSDHLDPGLMWLPGVAPLAALVPAGHNPFGTAHVGRPSSVEAHSPLKRSCLLYVYLASTTSRSY